MDPSPIDQSTNSVHDDHVCQLDIIPLSLNTETDLDQAPVLALGASSSSSSSSATPSALLNGYSDDLAVHTQLQLQLYLEDLDELDQAQELSIALAASVPSGSDILDPTPDWGDLVHTHSIINQDGTANLPSPALPTLPPTPFHLLGGHATASSDTTAGALNFDLIQEAGMEALNKYGQDNDDDDEEECFPPSQAKNILYEDLVSPVSIAEALTQMNDNLLDDVLEDQYRRQLALTKSTRLSRIGDQSLIQDDYDAVQEQQLKDHSLGRLDLTLHPTDMIIPLTPPGILSPDQSSPVPGPKDSLSEEETEESLQGRPPHKGGQDISLNLARTLMTPDTIHDLFFSRYYTRLVYLSLWDTNLGIWGAQAVGGLMADKACRVQYLNLGCNRLGFEGIVQLSGLYKNQSLVELNLSENHLGPKAVHSLQQIMVRLKKARLCNIRRLDLSNNEINDVGCISIAKIIMGTLLTHLDLSFNRISDWGASTILAAFESSEVSLKDINMEANPLSFAGGVDICKILVLPQSTITHLDLRGAQVTDVGVPYIAEALKSHQCPIVSLNLYDCQLTDTGILKLSTKLSVNKSLRVLGLGCNCIGDMGIIALSQGLSLNSYLEELDVSENDLPLSRTGLEALLTVMTTNTSLLELQVEIDGHPHDLTTSRPRGGIIHGLEPTEDHLTELQEDGPALGEEPPAGGQEPASSMGSIMNSVQSIAHLNISGLSMGDVQGPGMNAFTPTLTLFPTPAAQLHLPPIGFDPQALQQGVPHANGLNMERERRQMDLAMVSLKRQVRRNYRRTLRMRALCFRILVLGRVLMFAKDAAQDSNVNWRSMDLGAGLYEGKEEVEVEEPLEDENSAFSNQRRGARMPLSRMLDVSSAEGTRPLKLAPTWSGLPTPPLVSKFEMGLLSVGSDGQGQEEKDTKGEVGGMRLDKSAPRGTMAGLPWELKELILRYVDEEGLLSDGQFQAILAYGGSQWETERQAWDRWGDIREMVLEKTRCYYYSGRKI